ncbi:anti-sigma-F factor Fin family protein [Halobacillus salinarum]|uniref:Anti-sigma-F factor Fin family protein n=1 Tax=Halobacillus salinarum TaxID=2932257 RepID=A0ABY4END3_9BACI|nr:anti-sigma-F factor Fin [Halobacillus salinarum]UOQ45970.1 anti-sigma-F factor Fin family protein [Halobacillus salinarum]
MKIRYFCRQCNCQVGELQATEVDVSQLGSEVLNDADDQQVVHMGEDGEINITTLCDACKESRENLQ